MKCTIPEISWHNRDPVLSIDIQNGSYKTPKGETFWRIATGGADSHVLIWHLTVDDSGRVEVTCVADLERHQKAVNVVRFSPSKEVLASGDDESIIILWKQKEDCEFFVPSNENDNKEQWTSWKVLKRHLEDVYDIGWSPDSNSLVSGSVDNTAILWDVHKGRSTAILSDHKGFVQGVSWDPCNQYISTISTDRICRLIDINTKKTVQRVYKSKIPAPTDHPAKDKTTRLFYDDTFKSFFRRLTFSPDGTLIIVPSGVIEPMETTARILNATIVFSRHNLKEPLMILPSLDECTIAIQCCPIYFELRKDGPTATVPLPYRIVFAVATQHSVLIYDTQQLAPIAAISNIHYTRLTDVSWSSDGRILIVSSTDGYCTIINFQEGELGTEYKAAVNINEKAKTSVNSVSNSESSDRVDKSLPTFDADSNAMDVDLITCEKIPVHENITNTKDLNIEKNPKLISNNTEDKIGTNVEEETEDIKLVYADESTSGTMKTNVKKTPEKSEKSHITLNKAPRRVQLITLSSPKGAKKNESKLTTLHK